MTRDDTTNGTWDRVKTEPMIYHHIKRRNFQLVDTGNIPKDEVAYYAMTKVSAFCVSTHLLFNHSSGLDRQPLTLVVVEGLQAMVVWQIQETLTSQTGSRVN